jgi:hypothetical protein
LYLSDAGSGDWIMFMINDDTSTPQPNDIAHPAFPEVGMASIGYIVPELISPIDFTVQYQTLSEGDFQQLIDFFYSPANLDIFGSPWYHSHGTFQLDGVEGYPAIVKVTYDEPMEGGTFSGYFAMSYPEGVHEGAYFSNVTVHFSSYMPNFYVSMAPPTWRLDYSRLGVETYIGA